MEPAMNSYDVHQLLRQVAPIVLEGLASPAVAELADPVVCLLAQEEATVPPDVLILDRWRYLHAITAARGRRTGDDGESPPGSIRVSIATGASALEVDVPDPRARPDWWGLPPAQEPRPALRPGRAVRWVLDALRSLLSGSRGS